MKSFRQYISEAGIRRKMRKLEGVRKRYEKAAAKPIIYNDDEAMRAQNTELDRLDDAETDAMQAVAREQKLRRSRIERRALDMTSGSTPSERLASAAETAADMEEVSVPGPMRSRVRQFKARKAARK